MAKRYSQQFIDDAVQYRKNHPELTLQYHPRTQSLWISVSGSVREKIPGSNGEIKAADGWIMGRKVVINLS